MGSSPTARTTFFKDLACLGQRRRFRHLRGAGDENGKDRALAKRAFDRDVAAMCKRQFLADCQPQTCAAFGAVVGVFDLGEGFENAVEVLRGDADAIVFNLKNEPACMRAGA